MIDKSVVVERKKDAYLKFLHSASNKTLTDCYPNQVFIESYTACNYGCEFCMVSLKRFKGNSISEELFKKIVEDMHDKSQFISYFLQAEPTLHKNLPELVNICNHYHVDSSMVTNGSKLTKDLSSKLIQNGLEFLCVSTTGATPEQYNAIHHSGNKFPKMLRNLVDFLQNERELGRVLRTGTIWVDTKKVRHGLKRYKKMYSLLPVDQVRRSELISNWGLNGEVKGIPKTRADWLKVPTCTAPWRMMAIEQNGDVRACFIDNQSKYIVGNVNEQSPMKVWNGEKMQRFRKAVIERDFKETDRYGTLCSNCNAMVRPDALLKGNCWPYNYEKEAKIFRERNGDYFGHRSDLKKLKPKFDFIAEHGDRWIDHMIDPKMEDDQFIQKYAEDSLAKEALDSVNQLPTKEHYDAVEGDDEVDYGSEDNYKKNPDGLPDGLTDLESDVHQKPPPS